MNLQDFHLLSLTDNYIKVLSTYIFSNSFHTGLRDPLIVLVFIFWLPELFSGINLTCKETLTKKFVTEILLQILNLLL